MSHHETLDRAARRNLRLGRSTLIVSTAALLGVIACGADATGTGSEMPGPATTTTETPSSSIENPTPQPTADPTGAPTSTPTTTPTTQPTTQPTTTPTTQPTTTPTTQPTTTPPVTTSTTEYAPYFYTWGWSNSQYSFTSLVDLKKKVGTPAVTLAFVLGTGNCQTTTDIQSHVSDVKAYVAAGGHVKASFGGQGGTYLENTCGSASAMASALEAFVDATGITDLDFDVEQAKAETSTINALRAQALATVQKSRGIKVAFTLPATPTGMSSDVVAVVKAALSAGVTISHVNLMTMDYGSSISAGKKMSDLAISGANGLVSQLKSLIPGLTDAAGYAMVGITPMIGENDVSTENFSVTDAKAVATFATQKHVGLLSFWAIQRDRPCSGSADLSLCSNGTGQTANYQYDAAFRVASGG
jgi:chitinase